ncbi:YceI family protein [Aquabacter spiritensis]|uniref:YceI family protein n=1 Tax=Aquabacter spiritensis TaxID=933073 RepID=UPI001FDFAD0D|nr:YceI family protein [Aquabacter spiritensis]
MPSAERTRPAKGHAASAALGAIAALALPFAAIPPLSAQEAPEQEATSTSSAQVRAGTYAADPAHTRITWSVSHLGFSTYSGLLPAVEGTLVLDEDDTDKSRVEVTVPVARAGTLDPELDAHLKTSDFFDSAKYPTATFRSTRIEAAGRTARITGDLTLRGVTRPVTLDVTFRRAGPRPTDKAYAVGFDATATIKRSDFGMTAFLPLVGDAVDLRIEAEFLAK